MECPICLNKLSIPQESYKKLDKFKIGGRVLVSSNCCGTGFTLKIFTPGLFIYSIMIYKGEKKEDEWGTKLVKYNLKWKCFHDEWLVD